MSEIAAKFKIKILIKVFPYFICLIIHPKMHTFIYNNLVQNLFKQIYIFINLFSIFGYSKDKTLRVGKTREPGRQISTALWL